MTRIGDAAFDGLPLPYPYIYSDRDHEFGIWNGYNGELLIVRPFHGMFSGPNRINLTNYIPVLVKP